MEKVGIVIINGHNNEEWLNHAIQSAKSQVYPNFDIYVIDNKDRKKSIGQCWNEAVEKLEDCKYIYFLGDDDYISPDMLISSVVTLEMARAKDDTYVQCSSHITGIDKNGDLIGYYNRVPTGLWLREYLLKHKFNEELTQKVDTEAIERIEKNGYKRIVMMHHFGYFYRHHEGQVSGTKVPVINAFDGWVRKVYADKSMSLFKKNLIKYHNFVEVPFSDLHRYDGILVWGIYTEATMNAVYRSINKLILVWCGSDLIYYQKVWSKKYDLRGKENIQHICLNKEQKEILRQLGIENVKVLPIYTGNWEEWTLTPLPHKTGVLYYARPDFQLYGVDRLFEIASSLPNVDFYLIGDKGYLKKLLPNMINLGHISQEKLRSEVMKHIKIYMRLTKSDGAPHLIFESLLSGKFVIYNHDLGIKNISKVVTNEDAIKEIKRLSKYTLPNEKGREEAINIITNSMKEVCNELYFLAQEKKKYCD